MKNLIIMSSLVFSTLLYAQEKDCREKALSFITEDTEKILIANHDNYIDQFLDCDSPDLGLGVIIHETAHLEDLGVKKGDTLENVSESSPNIFLLDGEYIGIVKGNYPEPYKVIVPVLNENYVYDDNMALKSYVMIYMTGKALASTSFNIGMATELNGYTHGLSIEYRIKKSLPFKIFGNRWGLIDFLTFYKIYLFELKRAYPQEWSNLQSPENQVFMTKLLNTSADLLLATDHCNSFDDFGEKKAFAILQDGRFTEGLQAFIASEKLDRLFCR